MLPLPKPSWLMAASANGNLALCSNNTIMGYLLFDIQNFEYSNVSDAGHDVPIPGNNLIAVTLIPHEDNTMSKNFLNTTKAKIRRTIKDDSANPLHMVCSYQVDIPHCHCDADQCKRRVFFRHT
jgi:hypothetical protein